MLKSRRSRTHCTNECAQLLLLLLLLGNSIASSVMSSAATQDAAEKVLTRKRRYVAFPDGSSVAASICLTIGVIGNPHTDYLSWAENWGVAYNLPNYTWAKQHAHGFKNDTSATKAALQRRSRRDLYSKIELIIENMGYDGHSCIARALCESAKYLHGRRRGNMLEEIVKTIFSLPREPVDAHEPAILQRYDHIYRRARRETRLDCGNEYAQCQLSLLDLAFGQYTVEPTRSSAAAGLIAGLSGKFM